jgi:hypothetical protein
MGDRWQEDVHEEMSKTRDEEAMQWHFLLSVCHSPKEVSLRVPSRRSETEWQEVSLPQA